MNRKALAPAAMLAMVLTLSACGDDDTASSGSGNDSGTASSSTPSESSTATAEYNDADVMFAQSMIVHHRQAIEMAKLASTRAQSADVKQLAADVEAAQDPEIQTMSSWLTSWGADVPSDDMSGMDEDMGGMEGMNHSGMSGMMTDADMRKLRTASGTEFDRMFLQMMIGHHQGAIEMAMSEKDQGKNDEAVALAEKISSTQSAEITKMRELLGS